MALHQFAQLDKQGSQRPRNPAATAATLDADGWLHTGDIATVTADGVFTIVDRVKELIKYKGYQVPRWSPCRTRRGRRSRRRSWSAAPAPGWTPRRS
ncbi:hypothetical protein [Amycolatopsis tucumanensis]|uniref:AMP-dependent synthetase/ligase domain-containing protein n=1 Tax=Amycolatopsis tucumanensis TaxID=401106 RepID=A0ABP7HF75_9PSEU